MTLKEKIKNLSKTAKAGLVGLSLATLVGTFGGNEGGLSPIYNKFQENSKFYGLSIGFIQDLAKGKDSPYVKNNFYGVQIGVLNGSENLTGAQVGGFNGSENLTGAQIGIGNLNQKGWSAILGFGKGEK